MANRKDTLSLADMGAAGRGENNDISKLGALSGPTRLGGDAVDDYDAVTLRQARNMGGGSGPTMSGVMNFDIGTCYMRDSRALLRRNELPSDGQVVNRADWPELWAYAQAIGFITDAAWLADPKQRGKYTSGNGTTTFRVPDRNGVQTNSIPGLYARGDGGNSANDGTVQQNAAPNIAGGVNSVAVYNTVSSSGSLLLNNAVTNRAQPPVNAENGFGGTNISFDASKSNAAYGRDGATEIRTNSFIGVWVIRASGGFEAANTLFNIINGDTTKPAAGTLVSGGALRSAYKVGDQELIAASFRVTKNIGQAPIVRVAIADNEPSTPTTKEYIIGSLAGWTGGALIGDLTASNITAATGFTVKNTTAIVTGGTGSVGIGWNTTSGVARFIDNYVAGTGGFEFTMANTAGAGTNTWMMQPNGTLTSPGAFVPGSDERHKSEIEIVPNALDAVCSWRGVTYLRKDGDGGREVGLIAQDVEKDCPEAISTMRREFTDGEVIEDFKCLNIAGVAAAYHTEAIKIMAGMIAKLTKRIEELESSR